MAALTPSQQAAQLAVEQMAAGDCLTPAPGSAQAASACRVSRDNSFPCQRQRAMPVRRPIGGAGIPLLIILAVSLLCAGAPLFCPHDPGAFFLTARNAPPSREFLCGTDSLGRDIFTLLWYGGRSSLVVGALAALWASFLGLTAGIVSGLAPCRADQFMQRALELLQSVPALLLMLVLCALTRERSSIELAFIIGSCTWFALARLVRTEVRQLRAGEIITAARALGSSSIAIARRHLLPRLISALNFVLAASFSTAIAAEATLSFLGLGLPPEELSWGVMLTLANRALLLNTWWVIVFPGLMLLVVLGAVSMLCARLRRQMQRRCSNL